MKYENIKNFCVKIDGLPPNEIQTIYNCLYQCGLRPYVRVSGAANAYYSNSMTSRRHVSGYNYIGCSNENIAQSNIPGLDVFEMEYWDAVGYLTSVASKRTGNSRL
jgi:hypothetical protein